MDKSTLEACGKDAKAVRGSTQLSPGLDVGIECALHTVVSRAAEHKTIGGWEVDDSICEKTAEEGQVQKSLLARHEHNQAAAAHTLATQAMDDDMPGLWDVGEQEGLILVDTMHGFNILSRLSMLLTVQHRCTKMSRFVFNCYRHEIRLICRHPGGTALIILSKEGIMQGDPLVMALYGIALLPLA